MTEHRRQLLDKCLKITGSFEGAGYGGVIGNFDGQGLSAFILQWNLGQKTLQPLIVKMHDDRPDDFRHCFSGVDLVRLMAAVRSGDRRMEQDFVSYVTTGQPQSHPGLPFPAGGRKVKQDWRDAFRAVGSLFQEHQQDAALPYFTAAIDWCLKFGLHTERSVAFMFDHCVQRGKNALADEFKQYQEIRPVGPLTENNILYLLLNADLPDFRETFREDVKSRRTCIIEGVGVVHKTKRDLTAEYGLSDAIVL